MKVLGLLVLFIAALTAAPTAAHAQDSEEHYAVGGDDNTSYTLAHNSQVHYGPWTTIWTGACAVTSVAGRVAWAIGGALSMSGQAILTACAAYVAWQKVMEWQMYLQSLSMTYYGDPFYISVNVEPL